jgi:hypothetical protein
MDGPKRAIDRISTNLKRYQPILAAAKACDVSETDTRAIPAVLPGHDKCAEVTTEFAMRGICVDMPINVDGRVRFLI